MEEFNLVKLNGIGAPLAAVANNCIDKIAHALKWVVSPKNIAPYILEGHKSIIAEIAARQDIHPLERGAILNQYQKAIKEYQNQLDIIQLAIQHLEPEAKPEEVKNDWISFFFDKVKDVTEEEMKIIWNRILAGEFNKPNTYTKQLLHIISIMDSTLAKRFQKIRSSCFYSAPKLYIFIYRLNGNGINNIKKYQDMGIYISDLKELAALGLIEHRFSDFYTQIIKNKVFCYGERQVRLLIDKKSIALGNVSLTNVGKQLCKISPMTYDDSIFEFCFHTWEQLGYQPIVE